MQLQDYLLGAGYMIFVLSSSDRRSAIRRLGDVVSKLPCRLLDFCIGLREGKELMDRYEKLSRLSDRELERLGICRGEILLLDSKTIRDRRRRHEKPKD